MPKLQVDGPYGDLEDTLYKNDIVVLVGCGIGLAPWVSILKNIYHLRYATKQPGHLRNLRHVELVWISRDTGSLEWFRNLLSALESRSDDATPSLRIHIYMTRKMDDDAIPNLLLNSIGSATDPITGLKSKTNFGRPNFIKMFTSIRDEVLDGAYTNGLKMNRRATVGVYLGGPVGIGKSGIRSMYIRC